MNSEANVFLEILNNWQATQILVIGDLMLDEYHWCTANRISPEAPVPICRITKTTYVPGGASNVASNIASLNGIPHLAGYIGKDSTGENLKKSLTRYHISLDSIVESDEYKTILKSRIIAQNQHVVRLDRENDKSISSTLEYSLSQNCEAHLKNTKAIILSDYGKGTLTESFIQTIIHDAKQYDIPVIIDPKGDDYSKYKGATLLTPNFTEFKAAAHTPIKSEEDVLKAGLGMIQKLELENLVITRSEKGMSLLTKSGTKTDIPTKAVEVADITGAGDTVISTLALGLSQGLDLYHSAMLANYAAGIAVSKIGTSTVSFSELKTAIEQDR